MVLYCLHMCPSVSDNMNIQYFLYVVIYMYIDLSRSSNAESQYLKRQVSYSFLYVVHSKHESNWETIQELIAPIFAGLNFLVNISIALYTQVSKRRKTSCNTLRNMPLDDSLTNNALIILPSFICHNILIKKVIVIFELCLRQHHILGW